MRKWHCFFFLFLVFWSCTKEEVVVVPGNEVEVDYQYIPTEKIEFYLNRLFIDLIGREPLDEEMAIELERLKADTLSVNTRLELVQRLQWDTSFVEGDSSYLHAYSTNLYNLSKIKLLEGAGDREFYEIIGPLYGRLLRDSLEGNIEGYQITLSNIIRHEKVIESNRDFRLGEIKYNEMLGRMLNNNIYDVINMNTFNFVNASFDNLLLRYPTTHEFAISFDMCENDVAGTLFERTGANKRDYIDILTNSREMAQGIIIDVYRQSLSRDPSVIEMAELLPDIVGTYDVRFIQQKIMITDEYANF